MRIRAHVAEPAKQPISIDVDIVAAQFDLLDSETHRLALLEAIRARDVYRRLTTELEAKLKKLELGLIGPKSERFKGEDDAQLSLQVLAELLGIEPAEGANPKQLAAQLTEQTEQQTRSDGDEHDAPAPSEQKKHRRDRKPTGRAAARPELPKVVIELIPEEVKQLGLDAFERVGEESTTTYERRVSSLVEVTIVRPKFRAKTDAAIDALKNARAQHDADVEPPQAWFKVAPCVELPIPRAIAGPALLANVAVRRFDDHLPYNRLENVYEREGMRLGRSTLYGWLDALRELFKPLLRAILLDTKQQPYLCVDATGVLVLAPEKCKRGHFWVLIAPERHIVFAFSDSHDKEAVSKLLGGYDGLLVADAHGVYDHLYRDGGATEVGCWGHARSYFFKTLSSEPEIAKEFLGNLRVMFLLERKFADTPRRQRERMRAAKIKPLVDRHFELCRKYDMTALDGTPLRKAITYSLNQEKALRRFLDDGRLPATNNISERGLRRQAIGRNNWLFIASDDGAEVNTTFSTLIASCHLHDIEPEAYLRDLLCLLPEWPKPRVLELAPCNWKQTREQPETQRKLAQNVMRKLALGIDPVHSDAA